MSSVPIVQTCFPLSGTSCTHFYLHTVSTNDLVDSFTDVSEDGSFSAISISLWSLEVSLFILRESHGGWYQMWRFCISHPWFNLLFPLSLVWIRLDLGQGRFYPVVNPSASSSSSHFPSNTFSPFEPKGLFSCPLINCKLYILQLCFGTWLGRGISVAVQEKERRAHISLLHIFTGGAEKLSPCPQLN